MFYYEYAVNDFLGDENVVQKRASDDDDVHNENRGKHDDGAFLMTNWGNHDNRGHNEMITIIRVVS